MKAARRGLHPLLRSWPRGRPRARTIARRATTRHHSPTPSRRKGLVQRIRRPGALPLARRQTGEGEQLVPGLLQAVGHGPMVTVQ